jgi:hypothetical protein
MIIEQAIANAISSGKLQPTSTTNVNVPTTVNTSTTTTAPTTTSQGATQTSPPITNDIENPPIGPGSFRGQQAPYNGYTYEWNGDRWMRLA